MTHTFDKVRAQELQELRDLLYKIRGLNNGSNFLGKVQECIDSAYRLSDCKYDGDPCFADWLQEKCLQERQAGR